MKTYLIPLFILFAPLTLLAQTKSLQLSLGELKTLPLRGSGAVWIQDRNILKATPHGGGIQIQGQKEGMTVLKLAHDLYEVHVFHPHKMSSREDLKRAIHNIVGLNASFQNGEVLVSGRLYRWSDWQKLQQIFRTLAFSFQLQAQIPAPLRAQAQKEISIILKKSHLPPQTLIFEPQLEIRVATSEIFFQKYEKILRPYGIRVLKDDSSLEVAPTIKVQITVAEIKKDISLKYGLRWPSGYSAKVLPSGETVPDELPFNATALEAQGLGKILASPNIICRSGHEAEFLAGGEFPIKIMNYKVQDIVWKKYGIRLKVKPKADRSGRMSLSIETEVSTLDDSRRVDDIPGLLTNHVSSHFDLSGPRTIALSGLLKSEDSRSHEGLPFLARIPVLGALFSSKDFKENRSELVIFVRPSILEDEGGDGSGQMQHLGDTEVKL